MNYSNIPESFIHTNVALGGHNYEKYNLDLVFGIVEQPCFGG
jgi:hypothetical protein